MGRRRFGSGVAGNHVAQGLQLIERAAKLLGLPVNFHARFSKGIAQLAERMLALQSKVRQGALQYVETVEARTVTVS